jgi:hypothetical protein
MKVSLSFYPNRKSIFAAVSAVVASLPFVAQAQTQYYYEWTGAALQSDLINVTDNWWRIEPLPEENAVPLANNDNVHLYFGAAPVYALTNDLSGLRFRTLTFTRDAESGYTFEGDPIQVRDGGELINSSLQTHTFYDPLHVMGTGTSSFIVNTRKGDIELNGLTTPAGTVNLFKTGLGMLKLRGDISIVPLLTLRGGEVQLDVLNGATFASGLGVAVNSSTTGNNTKLTILADGGTVELGNLSVASAGQGAPAGMLRLVGAENTTLEFSTYTGVATGSADITHSINIDLSATGSAVKIPLGATMANSAGIYNSITVTSGGKTGFATLDDDGYVVRNTTFTMFPAVAVKSFENPPESRIFFNVNYAIDGDSVLSGGAGNHSVSTLTIQGSGTMSSTLGTQILSLQGGFAMLMEEDIEGDYNFDVRVTWGSSMGYIHQFNTDGAIYFNQGLGDAGAIGVTGGNNGRLVKDGMGTIVVGGTSNQLANSIWIHEGRLELNGEMTSVGARANHGIFVADTATLGGSGVIGTNAAAYGANTQAKIQVAAGGTLDASNNDKTALYIAGQVILLQDSNYFMNLGAVRGDAFHIARSPQSTQTSTTILTITDSNLVLSLLYAPKWMEKIVLLTWDSDFVRSGQFATVNGEDFLGDDGDLFFLSYGDYDYGFQLVYDDLGGAIYLVTIIPEPSTIVLLMGFALAGVVYIRRKQRI